MKYRALTFPSRSLSFELHARSATISLVPSQYGLGAGLRDHVRIGACAALVLPVELDLILFTLSHYLSCALPVCQCPGGPGQFGMKLWNIGATQP